jgi:hypothetical protein
LLLAAELSRFAPLWLRQINQSSASEALVRDHWSVALSGPPRNICQSVCVFFE